MSDFVEAQSWRLFHRFLFWPRCQSFCVCDSAAGSVQGAACVRAHVWPSVVRPGGGLRLGEEPGTFLPQQRERLLLLLQVRRRGWVERRAARCHVNLLPASPNKGLSEDKWTALKSAVTQIMKTNISILCSVLIPPPGERRWRSRRVASCGRSKPLCWASERFNTFMNSQCFTSQPHQHRHTSVCACVCVVCGVTAWGNMSTGSGRQQVDVKMQ